MEITIDIEQKIVIEVLKEKVIAELPPGFDILRVDFAIKSMGMNEDTQLQTRILVKLKEN